MIPASHAVAIIVENAVEQEYDPTLLNQLLSGVAHEISNCSQSILLIGQLLQEFWVDAEPVLASHMHKSGDFLAGGLSFSSLQVDMPDYLSSVVQNAGKIDSLIQELTSLFRASEASRLQAVDLNAVARSVQTLTAHRLKQAGFLLTLQTAERLPRVTARARDLVFGLATLIHRFCQTGGSRQGSLILRTQLDEQNQAVLCQLLLPAEAGLAEQLAGEPSQRLFARNAGSLEVQQAGETLRLTLSFPPQTKGGLDDGH